MGSNTNLIRVFDHIAAKMGKNMPLNRIYGEDWFLRLILFWFDSNKGNGLEFPLSFGNDDVWYAQGRLRGFLDVPLSVFDGAFGNIKKDDENSYFNLERICKSFVVLEAKMKSPFRSDTAKTEIDQVSRTIFCMCRAVETACTWQWPKIEFIAFLDKFEQLAFYSLVMEEDSGGIDITTLHNKDHIRRCIETFIEKEPHDNYCNNFFLPFLEKISIEIITWEEVIAFITGEDIDYGNHLMKFYDRCKKFN